MLLHIRQANLEPVPRTCKKSTEQRRWRSVSTPRQLFIPDYSDVDELSDPNLGRRFMKASRGTSDSRKCKECRFCLTSRSSYAEGMEFRARAGEVQPAFLVCLVSVSDSSNLREAAPVPVQLLLPGRDPVNSHRCVNSKT